VHRRHVVAAQQRASGIFEAGLVLTSRIAPKPMMKVRM
jgi:hypothetical protein